MASHVVATLSAHVDRISSSAARPSLPPRFILPPGPTRTRPGSRNAPREIQPAPSKPRYAPGRRERGQGRHTVHGLRRTVRRIGACVLLAAMTIWTGAIVGALGWLFSAAMELAIRLIWRELPMRLGLGGIREASMAQWPFWFTLTVTVAGAVALAVNERRDPVTVTPIMGVIARVRKTGAYGDGRVLPYFTAALLPLAFGSAVGPEAGLANVIGSSGTRFGRALHGVAAACLRTVRTGEPLHARDGSKADADLQGLARKVINRCAAVCGIIVFFGLGRLAGAGLALPRLGHIQWNPADAAWAIPAMAEGVAAGALFVGMTRLAKLLGEHFGDHILLRNLFTALALSIVATVLPFMLFSGESSLDVLVRHAAEAGPVMLVAIAVARCIITPLCINAGWRGGQFFPMIFSGVALGYALGGATGADPVFCAAFSSGALIAMVIRRPLTAAMIMLLVMPVASFPILLVSAYLASMIPLPRAFGGVPARNFPSF